MWSLDFGNKFLWILCEFLQGHFYSFDIMVQIQLMCNERVSHIHKVHLQICVIHILFPQTYWRVSRENWPVQGLKNWQFFGHQNCVKFVLFEVLSYIWYQNNQKLGHLKDTTPLFDIPDSMPTMIGYVQPWFEPWTGRFSHYTHQILSHEIPCWILLSCTPDCYHEQIHCSLHANFANTVFLLGWRKL